MTTSLKFEKPLDVEIVQEQRQDSPVSAIELGDGEQTLALRLVESKTCLEAAVSVRDHRSASRIVSLGGQDPEALMTEELRIRARDLAFERAIGAIVAAPDGADQLTLLHQVDSRGRSESSTARLDRPDPGP